MGRQTIKGLRWLALFMIVANIIGNILFALEFIGYNCSYIDVFKIEDINMFTAFSLIGLYIGIFFSKDNVLNEEEQADLNYKLRPVVYVNIAFVAYCFITLFILKIKILFLSALIMEALYIGVIIYSRKLYISIITDRNLKWQKEVAGEEFVIEDSSIFWRLKIWFSPIEKIKFKHRKFEKYWVLNIIAYVYFWYNGMLTSIIFLIFTILTLKSIISIFEYFLGLYSSLDGVCTGIESITDSEGSSNVRWKVYVTDYSERREIVYKTYNRPFFDEGNHVKIIHGVFSKYVIQTEFL